MNLSFKYRFILSFVTVEVFFILLIVAMNFFTINKSSTKLISNQIDSTTTLMSELIKSPMSVYDIATLDNIVKTKNFQHINSIIILDSNKRLLSKNYNLGLDISKIYEYKEHTTITIENKKLHLNYQPIMIDEFILGYLYIIYDMSENMNTIAENRTNTAILIILEILFSTVIAYFVGSKLTIMLETLADTATKIGKGQKVDIPFGSESNEVGLLSRAMNKMQNDLIQRNLRLKETEKVFENTKEAIVVLNSNGDITLVNKAFSDITGYEKNEIIDKNYKFFINKNNKFDFMKIIRKFKTEDSWQGELTNLKKDGKVFVQWLNITTIKDEDSKIKNFIVIFADITEEKERERLVQIQSKMATMGEMIGNIAHQWRQPLSAISSAASGMQLQKEMLVLTDEDFEKTINLIMDSTKFLSQTIEDFRNFFRTDKVLMEFNINDIVENNLRILEPIFKTSNIKIIKNIEDNLSLYGYKNELIQALLNIFNNAKDALNENFDDGNRIIDIEVKKIEDFIQIKISDNAGGIPKKSINKVFEPYFTTKHQSQGTGIGLYMTHTIITKHFGGKLEVNNKNIEYNNKQYVGASFNIKIPLIVKV